MRDQDIDDAVGEGHHDLPTRQGLRGQHLLAGEDHAGAAAGVVQVEPHQIPAGRHGEAHTAVAREGGWLDHRTAQVEQDLRLPVIEEATADPGQQGHGAAAAIDDREIRDEVAVQIAHRSPRWGRRRRTSDADRGCPPNRRWRRRSRRSRRRRCCPGWRSACPECRRR